MKILRLEKELEQARGSLFKIRKARYANDNNTASS